MFQLQKYQKFFRETGSFLLVGAGSTVVNYLVFLALLHLFHVPYLMSAFVGYMTGVAVGFFFNRSWTFQSTGANKKFEFHLYLATRLLSLCVGIVFLSLLVEAGKVRPDIANIFILGITTVLNFLSAKYIVFCKSFLQWCARIIETKNVRSYFSKLFFIILGCKILLSFFFASDVMAQGFVPFVQYFFSSGFANPYEFFFPDLNAKAFPYPPAMLFLLVIPHILAASVLPADVLNNVFISLFVTRIPVLLADTAIFALLCYFLPLRARAVTWLYWASPILIYINYIHGQLDVLPTALLFLALLALFKQRDILAFLFLGIGIATKMHLAAALPLFCIYLFLKKREKVRAVALSFLSVFVCALFLLPFLSSHGFIQMVFQAEEQQRLFNLGMPFSYQGLFFILAPAALIVVAYAFASLRRVTRDSFLLVLGVTYTILISLVPPMQGWFYWSVPFLIYFFVKYPRAPGLSFWGMTACYFGYFFFQQQSDIFKSFQLISPTFAALPRPYDLLAQTGLNAQLVQNIFFTGLEASLIMNVIWAYNVGIAGTRRFLEQPLMIGIGGDSGAGKSTLACLLVSIFGKKNTLCVNGDDIHKWPRGDANWNVFTHLNPKSNRLHQDLTHALALKEGSVVMRVAYDHSTGTFTKPMALEPHHIIIFQGLHSFFIERMRTVFDLKIFLKPHQDLLVAWKLQRDVNERGNTEEKVRAQIESRRNDTENYISPQEEVSDIVIEYHRETEEALTQPFRLRLEVRVKNSLPLDPLVEELRRIATLQVKHEWPEKNLTFQHLSVQGTAERKDIEYAAYRLIPSGEELLAFDPVWGENHHGVQQLLIAYCLGETRKMYAAGT